MLGYVAGVALERCACSIEYWFRVLDLEGDGVLSICELEGFYQEQYLRLQVLSFEPVLFNDILCQVPPLSLFGFFAALPCPALN